LSFESTPFPLHGLRSRFSVINLNLPRHASLEMTAESKVFLDGKTKWIVGKTLHHP